MNTIKKIAIATIMIGLTLAASAAPQDGRGRQRGQDVPPPPRDGQFAPGPGPQRPFDGPGQAGIEPPMGGIDLGRQIQMLTRTLDLTPEQQEAIKAILDEHRDAAQANRDAIRQTSVELRKAVMDGNPEAAEKLAEKLADAIIEQAVGQAETMKAVKAELTDEQLQKLDEIKTQMRDRFEQRRQGEGQGRWQRPEQGQRRFAPPPPRGEFDDEPLPPPQRPRRQPRQPQPGSAD